MSGVTRKKTNFISLEECGEKFRGKTVALIGSGPSALMNPPGMIESFDLIVRVQNYRTKGFEAILGKRTDVHYSFYGTSSRKTREELIADGVKLCMCKCPDGSLPFKSPWHLANGKPLGTDYRYIYTSRAPFWFCDTYAPTMDRFMQYLSVIQSEDTKPPYVGHQPTTGFACMLDLMSFGCDVFVTGFDFFTSGIHNLNQAWEGTVQNGVAVSKNPTDPMRHRPDLEMEYMRKNWPQNWTGDARLVALIGARKR